MRLKLGNAFERALLLSRYLLNFFYLMGLITLGWYIYSTGREIWDLITAAGEMDSGIVVFLVLDAMMIANVLFLITAGSYVVYVRDPTENHGHLPPVLKHLTPNSLKKSMAASLVGISSVKIAQIFATQGVQWDEIRNKVVLHIALIIGLALFFVIDHLTHEEKDSHA